MDDHTCTMGNRLMNPEVLLVEPFYGGSHKQLMDLLNSDIEKTELYTMSSKKWHWRARTSALYFSRKIKRSESFKVLFASSVLNLAELIALRPDLGRLRKVLYFHENQLEYPVQKQLDRDFQYGYNQILSCLVADVICFNSEYNMKSFLSNIIHHMNIMPDYRPKGLIEEIKPKCRVLYYPILYPTDMQSELEMSQGQEMCTEQAEETPERIVSDTHCDNIRDTHCVNTNIDAHSDDTLCHDTKVGTQFTKEGSQYQDALWDNQSKKKKLDIHIETMITSHENLARESSTNLPIHIVWPHRWEHDKNPESLFSVLYDLHEKGIPFKLSVLGECYQDHPAIFKEAKARLCDHVLNWGHLDSKHDYYKVLTEADVVISTSNHEFFGVAMLEAVHLGCHPLVPNRLVYPEIYGFSPHVKKCFMYNTDNQLRKMLENICKHPNAVRNLNTKELLRPERFSWETLKQHYLDVLSPQSKDNCLEDFKQDGVVS